MRTAALALLVAAALPASASATPVTILLNGTWDYVDDTGGVVAGAVSLGTPYTANFTYDDAASDQNPVPGEGNYDVGALPFSFTLSTGGLAFSWVSGGFAEIDLINGVDDSLSVDARGLSGGPGLPPIGFSYLLASFDDSTGSALSSATLVGLAWDLSDWNSRDMALFFDVDDGDLLTYVDLGGTVDGLTVVPEPGSLALLAGGALALAGWRRRHGDSA